MKTDIPVSGVAHPKRHRCNQNKRDQQAYYGQGPETLLRIKFDTDPVNRQYADGDDPALEDTHRIGQISKAAVVQLGIAVEIAQGPDFCPG